MAVLQKYLQTLHYQISIYNITNYISGIGNEPSLISQSLIDSQLNELHQIRL